VLEHHIEAGIDEIVGSSHPRLRASDKMKPLIDKIYDNDFRGCAPNLDNASFSEVGGDHAPGEIRNPRN
jgi:hypothetical protein